MQRSISSCTFGSIPRLAERRQVLPRVAVEHQLVVHDLEGRVPADLRRREAVLRDVRPQSMGGEDGVEQLVAHRLAFVQGHVRSSSGQAHSSSHFSMSG